MFYKTKKNCPEKSNVRDEVSTNGDDSVGESFCGLVRVLSLVPARHDKGFRSPDLALMKR